MKNILFISTVIFAAYSWTNIQPANHSINSWEGVYTSKEGELKITNETSTGFNFSVSVANEECTGEIGEAKATATIKGNYTATYSDGDCKLTFQFDGKNTISILEKECDEYHGMMCSFEGTYKRK